MHLEELKKHISYDPVTGVIKRLDRVNGYGSIDHYGYLVIKIKGRQYKAHRLAWLYHYGKWPEHNIDHINRNKLDNRIANLRDVPQAVNVYNTYVPPNKTTGYRGIHISPHTKKRFTTKINKKTYRFYTIEEAIDFRKKHITI